MEADAVGPEGVTLLHRLVIRVVGRPRNLNERVAFADMQQTSFVGRGLDHFEILVSRFRGHLVTGGQGAPERAVLEFDAIEAGKAARRKP